MLAGPDSVVISSRAPDMQNPNRSKILRFLDGKSSSDNQEFGAAVRSGLQFTAPSNQSHSDHSTNCFLWGPRAVANLPPYSPFCNHPLLPSTVTIATCDGCPNMAGRAALTRPPETAAPTNSGHLSVSLSALSLSV
ncbi:hypothetical protein Q8A73_004094 [Channa argus]|nr:hypothetical protein Q8A73_004094 [Channa argus]